MLPTSWFFRRRTYLLPLLEVKGETQCEPHDEPEDIVNALIGKALALIDEAEKYEGVTVVVYDPPMQGKEDTIICNFSLMFETEKGFNDFVKPFKPKDNEEYDEPTE